MFRDKSQEAYAKALREFVQRWAAGCAITESDIERAINESSTNPAKGFFRILEQHVFDPKTPSWKYTEDPAAGGSSPASENIDGLIALLKKIYDTQGPQRFPETFSQFLKAFHQFNSPDRSSVALRTLEARILAGIEPDTLTRTQLDLAIRLAMNPLPVLENDPTGTAESQQLLKEILADDTPDVLVERYKNKDPFQDISSPDNRAKLYTYIKNFETLCEKLFSQPGKRSGIELERLQKSKIVFYAMIFGLLNDKLDATEFQAFAKYCRERSTQELNNANKNNNPSEKAVCGQINAQFSTKSTDLFYEKQRYYGTGAAVFFGLVILTLSAIVLFGLSLGIGVPPIMFAPTLGIIAGAGIIYAIRALALHSELSLWDYYTTRLSKASMGKFITQKHLVPEAKASPKFQDLFTLNGLFLFLCLGFYLTIMALGDPLSFGIIAADSFVYFGLNPGNSMLSMLLLMSFSFTLSAIGSILSKIGKIVAADHPGIQSIFDTIKSVITNAMKFNMPMIMINSLKIGTSGALISKLGLGAVAATYASIFIVMGLCLAVIALTTYQIAKGKTTFQVITDPAMLERIESMPGAAMLKKFVNIDLENARMYAIIGLVCSVILLVAAVGAIANPFAVGATLGLMLISAFAYGLGKVSLTKLWQRDRTQLLEKENQAKLGDTPLMILGSTMSPGPEASSHPGRAPASSTGQPVLTTNNTEKLTATSQKSKQSLGSR